MTERPLWFEHEGLSMAATVHVPRAAGKVPGVILCHGFTGNRICDHRLFVKLGRRLAERGLAALRFDCRGCGESGGDFVDTSVTTYVSDAARALDVLAELDGIDPDRLGVLGLSLGGAVAASLAGRTARVRSLVLWAPVAHVKEVVLAKLSEKGIEVLRKSGTLDVGGELMGLGFLDDAFKVRPLDDVVRSEAPVLLIHGSADESVPLLESQSYERALRTRGGRVERRLIEGADHVFSSCDHESEAIDLTADWFCETL